MRTAIFNAAIVPSLAIHRVKVAAVTTKTKVIENKSELTHLAATVAVVGVAAHVVGFKAGYAHAATNN